MKNLTLFIFAILITSCYTTRKYYYESPLTGNASFYFTQPKLTDTTTSCYYANISIYSGYTNDKKSDGVNYSSYMLYKTGSFKQFQYYFGANFLFGDYWHDSLGSYRFIDNQIYFNSRRGKDNFSALGLQGGICYTFVYPLSEWRILGLNYSYAKEFGDYLKFRNSLKDGAVEGNIKENYLHNLGISSEILFRRRKGDWGFKMGLGYILNNNYFHPDYYDIDTSKDPYYYYLINYHYTRNRITAYFQGDFGKFSSGITFGMTYKLK